MRNEPNLRIEQYRDNSFRRSPAGKNYGDFRIPRPGGILTVVSSGTAMGRDGDHGWEHVSVSLPHRCPTWEEMCYVKNLFWRDDETVVQFHPKKSEYKNEHPYVLHMWKKMDHEYELPPGECV